MQERGNMSQIDKLINKIENYRSSDQISFSELEKYLIYGLTSNLVTLL